MTVLARLIGALLLLIGSAAIRSAEAAPPPVLEGVALEDRIGERVPTDVVLTDHLGRTIALGELLDGERPLILVLAYYRCPMLCGLTINGVAKGLAALAWVPGDEFQVATVSFDPRDGSADAERARSKALELLEREVDEHAWPFLTGDEREVGRLADALGFHYVYDERTDQYAHPSAVFVLSPRGELSRVLYGFEYPALDLRMALVEAGEGKVGSLAEQALISCYRYDPAERRYGFWVLGFFRVAGVLLVLTVGSGMFVLIRRDLRRTRAFFASREGER